MAESPINTMRVLCRFDGCDQIPMHRLNAYVHLPVDVFTAEKIEVEVEIPVCAFHKGWLMDEAIKGITFKGPRPKRGV